jgi:hypothetical protein
MIEAGLARARGGVSGSSGAAAKLGLRDGIRNQSPRYEENQIQGGASVPPVSYPGFACRNFGNS